MPKHEKRRNLKKAKMRVVDLLADLEECLIAAGYSFEGVRTSSVPTVFETLLEALRLDGYDIDPIEFGGIDGVGVNGRRERDDAQRRQRPKGQRSATDINRREWKRWLQKSPRGSHGQRIFIRMRGPHAHAGIPGAGKRR